MRSPPTHRADGPRGVDGSGLLLLPHHREDAEEDVGEVEEDVDGHIDGVVDGAVHALRLVQVVDHDSAEEDDAGVVQDADDDVIVEPQEAQDGRREVQQNQANQASHQGRSPHLQVLGQHRTDEAGKEHDAGGDDERLDDALCGEHRDERPRHCPYASSADQAAGNGDGWVIVGLSPHGTGDAHEHEQQDEAQVHQLVGELDVMRQRCAKRSHPNIQGNADRHDEHERSSGDVVGARLDLAVQLSGEAIHESLPFIVLRYLENYRDIIAL